MQARDGVIPSPAAAAARRRSPRPLPVAPQSASPAPWSFRLLLLFLLLLYANLPLHFPQLEQAGPAQTVAVAALVVLFFEKWLAGRAVRLAWPESYLLLGFVGIAGLSVVGALWSRYAAEQVVDLLKIVAAYLLVLNTVDSWRRLRLTMGALVVGGLVPAVGSLIGYSQGDYARGQRVGWVGIFENPNDLAYSLVLLLPLALALAPRARLLARPFYWGAALVYTAAILLSFSRGGLLGLWVVALLCLLSWGSASARILGALVMSASLVFASSFWTRDDTGGEILDQETIELRLITIKAGAAMLADRPILGVGLGCSLLGWPLYAPPDAPTDYWLHTHNTVVQVFTETGLLGGTVFLLVVGATMVGAYRAARRLRRSGRRDLHRLVASIGISLVGFLVCGLTAGYLLSWFPYLLLGLASAARLLAEPPRPVAVAAPPAAHSRIARTAPPRRPRTPPRTRLAARAAR
ncbi:MAG TPA: O-antigen ligase family protein [Thermoanaerobaculia bacterium]|nr:O-antigen ligase family protein [Thermoanaerobaculia bacterium]